MRYQRVRTIGTGTGSTVYLCKDRVTNSVVALKVINNKSHGARNTKVLHEVQLLTQLRGLPGVVQLLHYFADTTGSFCMVFEKADMTLLTLLRTDDASGTQTFRPLSETWAKFLFSQLVNGVAVIHNQSIAHRDLKPENMLLFKTKSSFVAKLCDFGFARKFEHSEKASDACGSPFFCPPEVLYGRSYSPFKADIWSLGVTLYLMVFGQYPFQCSMQTQDANDVAAAVRTLFLQIQVSDPRYDCQPVSSSLVDLLQHMLCKNPRRRMSIQDVLRHCWFTERSPKLFTAQTHSTSINAQTRIQNQAKLHRIGRASSFTKQDKVVQPTKLSKHRSKTCPILPAAFFKPDNNPLHTQHEETHL